MFQLNSIKLRVVTAARTFGADVEFDSGLNLILADNSSGKSTLLQAIVYCLGLERMLGPSLAVPLPYAMRERIHSSSDAPYEAVLSSFVELAIENMYGRVAILRRDVEGGADRKLIRVRRRESGSEVVQDFFVHDAGAAQHEDGFHQFLATFIGWELPDVPTFDGREVPLYIETLFPMFFVEQKRGWSTVQGPIPTFLRIQDVARRVMEFILNLDAGKARRRQSELRALISGLRGRWDSARTEIGQNLPPGIRVGRLPPEPTPEFLDEGSLNVEIFYEGEWLSRNDFIVAVDQLLADLDKDVEAGGDGNDASMLEIELAAQRDGLDQLNVRQETIRQEWSILQADGHALSQRISTLRSDLVRNQDAAKLKRLGSTLGRAASEHVCPTCHQELASELLPSVSFAAMAVDENIVFIRSQLELCEAAYASSVGRSNAMRSLYLAMTAEISERQQRIRQLRAALVRPTLPTSRAAIERIVTLRARKEAVTNAQEYVDESIDNLVAIAREHAAYSAELKSLRTSETSADDRDKFDSLAAGLRRRLTEFGFKSFPPAEVGLSDDNFRPVVTVTEGGEAIERELGFEMSASDGIRMKWAYYLALLSTCLRSGGNHAGLLVFDEPGQQAMELESLKAFLLHCAGLSVPQKSQLIVAATTEKVFDYRGELRSLGAKIVEFEGFVLHPV